MATSIGSAMIEPVWARPCYGVVYPGGVAVRTNPEFDNSMLVRVIPMGEVAEGTGLVDIWDNFQRIQVSLMALVIGGRGEGVTVPRTVSCSFCCSAKCGKLAIASGTNRSRLLFVIFRLFFWAGEWFPLQSHVCSIISRSHAYDVAAAIECASLCVMTHGCPKFDVTRGEGEACREVSCILYYMTFSST